MKVTKLSKTNKLTQSELKNDWLDALRVNEIAISKYVKVVRTNQRQGSVKTKDRSEVSGGGRKPWRQKGTGRARHGSTRSPIWAGGGVTFGPDGNKNYDLKMNKKEKKLALGSILKKQIDSQSLVTADLSSINKTKKAAEIISAVVKSGKTLIVTDTPSTRQAFSNIDNVYIRNTSEVSGLDLATRTNIIFDEGAFKTYLEGRS